MDQTDFTNLCSVHDQWQFYIANYFYTEPKKHPSLERRVEWNGTKKQPSKRNSRTFRYLIPFGFLPLVIRLIIRIAVFSLRNHHREVVLVPSKMTVPHPYQPCTVDSKVLVDRQTDGMFAVSHVRFVRRYIRKRAVDPSSRHSPIAQKWTEKPTAGSTAHWSIIRRLESAEIFHWLRGKMFHVGSMGSTPWV